ncbi:MAG TPA: phosphate butyryltransferase [Firmicutes bacterium]|nr:phosphate butyryltransferase [Bacillota bacterium]HCT35441.1 phosphate butyryltransferase [Bacillota bacterium]
MIRSFSEIHDAILKEQPRRLAVAAAADKDVLTAVKMAVDRKLAGAVLVGDEAKIRQIAAELDFNLSTSGIEVVHEPDGVLAARKAVTMVSSGEAHLLMKGLVATADLLRAVLDKEHGLRTGRLLSHVGLLQAEGYDRLFYLTDGGMNIAPTLVQKVDIINNAVDMAHLLDNPQPKVACLAAVEVVNPDMPATLDAAALTMMSQRGQFKGCAVDGPLALDNAVSVEASRHKGISSPAAGQADILMVPEIESGNVIYKAMVYFGNVKSAGVIVGARTPIVLTSRADTPECKLNSMAVAVLMAARKK